jgi:putative PIN family toxin of toxin-antitoxin system
MKVVVDTNVFVMSYSTKSKYYDIFRLLKEGWYELVVTNDILLEYEEVMTAKYGEAGARFFLGVLDELSNVEFIRSFFHWNFIKEDTDDNKYVDAVFATNAEFLVSEDKHFKILKDIDFPKITVIGIDDFLLRLRDLESQNVKF